MAKRYLPVLRDQPMLLPPDMRDWLPSGHPVWLVISVVEDHLDTSAFHRRRKTGGAGTAGYDPDMMVALLVWAYANRVTSSRRIERLCWSDAAFMVICGGNRPDYSTICRFREQDPDAMEVLFAEVLGLCARLGMGKLGVVTLDGMKMTANASKSANRTLARLRDLAAETVAEHAATDAAEDEAYGPGRAGDEVPEEAQSPQSRAGKAARAARIARALAGLQAEQDAEDQAEREDQAAKAERFRERKAAGKRTGPAPASAEVQLAQERVDQAIAAQQAKIDGWNARDAADRAAGGPGLDPRTRPRTQPRDYVRVREEQARLDQARARAAAREAARETAEEERPRSRNITDPDSRLMPTRNGFTQGYNTQNDVSEDGLIIATEVTTDTGDVTWFEPMLEKAQAAAGYIASRQPPASATAASPPPAAGTTPDSTAGSGRCQCGTCGTCLIGLFLADSGYLSEHNLTCPGPDRLIATAKTRDLEKNARDPAAGTPPRYAGPATAAMAERLTTEAGITAYRQRGHIAETPHGNIKHNLGIRQFSLRGLDKVTAEWNLITAVHNLFKAISTGHLTTQALTTL
ncbi:MAG TPA: transposase [Streptosporangiaceae bacterium]|nr:transposase [Streptosporangiaceae bacterium]